MRVFLAAADIDYFIMLNLYGFCIQVYPRVAKYKEMMDKVKGQLEQLKK